MQRIKKAFVFIFSRVKTRLSLDELQRDIYIVTKKKQVVTISETSTSPKS